MAKTKDRGWGKTSSIVLEAIAKMLRGEHTLILNRSEDASKDFMRRVTRTWYDLGYDQAFGSPTVNNLCEFKAGSQGGSIQSISKIRRECHLRGRYGWDELYDTPDDPIVKTRILKITGDFETTYE